MPADSTFGLFTRANAHAGLCWRWMEALAEDLARHHPPEHQPAECRTCALLNNWDGDDYAVLREPPVKP